MNSTVPNTDPSLASTSPNTTAIVLGSLFALSEIMSMMDKIKPNGILEAAIMAIQGLLSAIVKSTSSANPANTPLMSAINDIESVATTRPVASATPAPAPAS